MSTLQTQVTQLGGLTVRLVEAEGVRPDFNLVLCHGYGAGGDDLVGIGVELLQRYPWLPGRVRCVFPAAPLALAEMGAWGGRAWWQLDVERLMGTRDFSALQREVPEGLPHSRRMLEGALAELAAGTGVPLARTVLGGFSQGAMLATDVALRAEEAPAGLCILSGTLVAKEEWARLAPRRAGLPVFQSHGHYDNVLPYAFAEQLQGLLQEAGLQVEAHPFDGPHGIPAEVVDALAAWLERRLR